MSGSHVPASAALMIVGATLCFTSLDSIVKHLSATYPIPLLVWARWTAQVVATALWLGPRMKLGLVRTRRLKLQVARGIAIVVSGLLFMTALKTLPLADATALNYTSPVLVIVIARFYLRERLTPLRVAFIVAGIIGMLLIVKPGSDIFRGASLLVLVAACVYASFQIMTRLAADEDPRVTLFYPALICTVVMTPLLPFLDIRPDMPWRDTLLVGATGLLGTLGHFMFILAFQRAPASALTPFTYMHLVWAMLVGWLLFGDLPDGASMVGMLIIAGSGLAVALFERRRARPMIPEPPAVD
ncbi:MAG: DMT family transporter [Betaproteobacteria bacterium]